MMMHHPAQLPRPARRPGRRPASFALRVLRSTACALVIAVGALAGGSPASAAPTYTRTNKLFNGTPAGPYHSYRIPAMCVGYQGALFMFCEAHVSSASDWGTSIDLIYKRSLDNGANWEPTVTLAGAANTPAGSRGWTNPTAVYEPTWSGGPAMGRIHLFFNWHSEAETGLDTLVYGDTRVYYMYSDTNGASWSSRVNLTSTLNPSSLGLAYDNVGPGIGIRKTQTSVGQLVVPALSRNFYSNNHGATWAYERCPPAGSHPTNEGAVVECLDGMLLRNDRPKGSVYDPPNPATNQRRWVSYGEIGGAGFAAYYPLDSLLDPKCQASILRYNFNSPDRVIFLNSSSTANRCRMKVRVSYDDGVTWPRERWLYVGTPPNNYANVDAAMNAGMGGYSSMIKTADLGSGFKIAAGVEISEGGLTGYDNVANPRSIDFHLFNLDWILEGQGDP